MDQLTRLQVLTEMVREFKTAILMNRDKVNIGNEVLEIINASGDTILYDKVWNARLKMFKGLQKEAVDHLDDATKYLHNEIDLLNQKDLH